MKEKKIIFLVGPPGAGKDTQVNLLAKKTGFYKFVTGDEGLKYIEANKKDPFTAQQKVNYDNGILFDPEWLLNKVQKERAKKILKSGSEGIVFSGSPRTLYEAKNLSKVLSEIVGPENIFTIVIEISENELKKRAKERLVCKSDENHTFSKRFSDLKEGDVCSKCGGILGKKGLDSEKEVEVRIQQYDNRTKPGIEYLKKDYKVFTIDGEQSIEKVHKDIIKNLGL